jgi:hypothetical protein
MMGGGRGGGRPGTRAVRPMPALQGGALFVAQAMVFGHYLQAREGDRFIGALVDAQMQGQPVASVLASARMVPGDVQRLDEEWRHWLDYQSRNRRR